MSKKEESIEKYKRMLLLTLCGDKLIARRHRKGFTEKYKYLLKNEKLIKQVAIEKTMPDQIQTKRKIWWWHRSIA